MKICLCGSTRFMDQFHAANVALSLVGHIVYSVATSTKGDFQPTDDQKLMLDMVHLRKIHDSDVVVVVGQQEDGSTYIGESTRREIAYALTLDKDVVFYDSNPAGHLHGPSCEFEKRMKAAAETNAVRDARKAQDEERRQSLMETLGLGLPAESNSVSN